MKYCVVILDGASGWPVAKLGGKTTLQAAATPHLDELAASGMLGMAATVPQGFEPSSSAACTSILGYDPVADYVGRGAIEAASMGIELGPDDVALRLNLVTIADGRMASYAAGHIQTEESQALVASLAETLDDDVFRLFPGIAYRHILVVRGHSELLDVAYTPPHDISGKRIDRFVPRGGGADLLLEYMERAKPILRANGVNRCRIAEGELPVTDVWPFWPGVTPQAMQPFAAKYGASAAMTSGVDLLGGLAVLFGIERLAIPGVTDGADNDYAAQAEGALAALDYHDVVVIHVEAPDEEGHAGSWEGKVEAIEAIDREVVARVREYAASTTMRILAMPDHPTPVEIKTHVGEAVPFVLAGPGISPNGSEEYDEEAARETGVLVDPGYRMMDLLLGRQP
ncbi:MAG: cofactor-independent phosphoglycerate mutase [Coriobacteriales bacterium]|nr:cofactor-independent phosphoglycerate mutase [Coriobacteriales bacterium]